MSSALSIALSSLKAESDAINSTGHNLANINTTGFKGSEVAFQDLVASSIGGGTSLGLGVSRPLNHQIFSQGAISSSSSPWAVAIQGNGFFMVKSPDNQQLYTRDGDFMLSSTGVLQTLSGNSVQGWTTSANGVLSTNGAPGSMLLSTGSVVPPIATSQLAVAANLNAAGVAPSTNTLSVPVHMTDSLGDEHTVTINFTKSTSAANTWTYDATIAGDDLAGGTPGAQVSILSAPGTLTFKSDGTLDQASQASIPLTVSGLANGAKPLSVSWNPVASDGSSAITQYSQASTYDITVDGSPAGQLSSISIGNGGQILASYSNGQQKVAGQIALATFRNTDSLADLGDNTFSATGRTSTASIGLPETGGRGQILAGSLEGSTVDIATQFTNLITYQRGYQASSRVITTADQMLQDIMAIIR